MQKEGLRMLVDSNKAAAAVAAATPPPISKLACAAENLGRRAKFKLYEAAYAAGEIEKAEQEFKQAAFVFRVEAARSKIPNLFSPEKICLCAPADLFADRARV